MRSADADDREEPVRPPKGRSGARFPSAAMLRRWAEEDQDASAEPNEAPVEPEPEPVPVEDAEPAVMPAGARFPSAALLRRWETEEQDELAEAPDQAQGPSPSPPADADRLPEPEPTPVAAFVRPYVLTGGRTRPGRYLGVETLVSAQRSGPAPRRLPDMAHRAVVDLCARPKSVAEVAALMMVPLGVARVLVGDLAQVGALFVHPAPTASGMPDAVLMNRVLHGLRRL